MDDASVDTDQPTKKNTFVKKLLPIIILFVFVVVVLLVISKNKSKNSRVFINTTDSECDDETDTDTSSVGDMSGDYDLYSEIKGFIARQTNYVMNN